MYRIAIDKSYKWKNSKRRKPLIIEGARQVGKTWLMKEFGRSCFQNVAYINFYSDARMLLDGAISDIDYHLGRGPQDGPRRLRVCALA